jgi:hypothetical protein
MRGSAIQLGGVDGGRELKLDAAAACGPLKTPRRQPVASAARNPLRRLDDTSVDTGHVLAIYRADTTTRHEHVGLARCQGQRVKYGLWIPLAQSALAILLGHEPEHFPRWQRTFPAYR